jgi:UDP-2,4-diacetamido-2,4,6-trideoxy-beta-L-altropyranose hydrolase
MFLIRADGNAKIGAGHLMRCMTIAQELGQEVWFVCADEDSAQLARSRGFVAKSLGSNYADMESELPAWEALIKEVGSAAPVTILVDSYYVTDAYLQALRTYGKVVLMDDLCAKAYPVDAVINYNAPAKRSAYEALYRGQDTKLLIGSTYVPLREQFLRPEYTERTLREEVKEVLITTGGGDVQNLAGKILELIYRPDLQFHVTAGQFSPNYEALKAVEQARENVTIHSNVTDMAGLMAGVDLAITAGGSTIYELSSLGVPFVCFSYAQNQEALTAYIGEQKVAGFAGAYHRAPEEMMKRMCELFEALLADKGLRERYFEEERKLADGRGAARLANDLSVV